jgi:hypothetical protein
MTNDHDLRVSDQVRAQWKMETLKTGIACVSSQIKELENLKATGGKMEREDLTVDGMLDVYRDILEGFTRQLVALEDASA